jgi:hypothetical protein
VAQSCKRSSELVSASLPSCGVLPHTKYIAYPHYISCLTYMREQRTLRLTGKQRKRTMQQLKEAGIYALPSQRGELVAHAVFRGGYVLYTPTDWEFFGPYTYESDRAGNILLEGQSTRWHIDDLAYTNRSARSRSRSGAAQKPVMSE